MTIRACRAQMPVFYIRTSTRLAMDAFRDPLGGVFRVHSKVMSFHSAHTNRTLRDVGNYVEESAVTAGVHLNQLLLEFGVWSSVQTTYDDWTSRSFEMIPPSFTRSYFYHSSMPDLFFGICYKTRVSSVPQSRHVREFSHSQ